MARRPSWWRKRSLSPSLRCSSGFTTGRNSIWHFMVADSFRRKPFRIHRALREVGRKSFVSMGRMPFSWLKSLVFMGLGRRMGDGWGVFPLPFTFLHLFGRRRDAEGRDSRLFTDAWRLEGAISLVMIASLARIFVLCSSILLREGLIICNRGF